MTNAPTSETLQEALRAAMMRDAEAARVRAQAAELKIVPASELIDYTPHQAGRASTVDEHIFNSPHQTGRRS